MKHLMPSILFTLLVQVLNAQQDIPLPGVVVEQNSQYRTGKVIYLPNAEIKSAGASPKRSDVNGSFTLVFVDRPGGDVARIFADKSGYELVNEEELKQASVIGRLRPLKIVMCKKGKLYDNQIAYYNIAKDASIAAYERKVAALQKQGKERDRLLAELRVQFNQELNTLEEAKALLDQQRQQAEQQAKELADKWVTVNLDDESLAYQRAFAAFEAKNIGLAKAILDSVNLEQRLALNSTEKAKEQDLVDTLQKNIAKRAEEIQQDVNMCLFKARLHKLDFEWAKAEYFYDLAVQYDKGNWDVTFEVALYMKSQNQFSKARTYCEKTLTQTNKPFERGLILNILGDLLQANNEILGAKKAYEEALLIYRQLAEKNPDFYRPDVAMTLRGLGSLLKANNEMSAAKQAYDEALRIYRPLAEKNPNVYRREVAGTLSNLGLLLQANNEMLGAKKAYEEALQIQRSLAEKTPEVYRPEVAITLNNLGLLLQANNEMLGAKKAYEEVLQIRRPLAEKNPDAYRPDMAATLNNLGILLQANNEILGAKKAFEEAMQIYRQLAEKNPDVYLPYVAGTLNNLGILLQANNEILGAKKAFEEAVRIYRPLAEKNSDVYLPYVAGTLNNLGALFKVNNEMLGAKKAFEEALQIRRQLAERNPQAYNLEVAMTDINIGLFYEQLFKTTRDMALKSAGLALMQDAVQRLAIFPDTHPRVQQYKPYIQHLIQFFKDFDEAAFQLQKQIERLGILETENQIEKDPHQKVRRQQEILGILSEIEKANPGNAEEVNMIASKYGSLAWYQLFVRQFAEAEQSARTGLTKNPKEEWINTNLALALLYQGKWAAAKQIYENLKDKPYGEGTYKAVFLEDFDALEKEGITHPDVAKARNLLGKK